MAMQPAVAAPLQLPATNESSASAVSWAAVIAGSAVAAAISLLLAALGTGLGFSSISAWPNSGASAATFSVATAIWLIVMQWIASAAGGYVTGRMRTKWVSVHTHEVFFRDTAHGLVTWAVATVLTVSVVAFAAAGLVREGARAATTVAAGAARGGATAAGNVGDYSVDLLLRAPSKGSDASDAPQLQARAEATRILATSLSSEGMTSSDRTYLAQLVANRTGLSPTESEERVEAVVNQVKAAEVKARQAADAARKVAATTSIFTALAMLIGAFIACVSAALGGRERDLQNQA